MGTMDLVSTPLMKMNTTNQLNSNLGKDGVGITDRPSLTASVLPCASVFDLLSGSVEDTLNFIDDEPEMTNEELQRYKVACPLMITIQDGSATALDGEVTGNVRVICGCGENCKACYLLRNHSRKERYVEHYIALEAAREHPHPDFHVTYYGTKTQLRKQVREAFLKPGNTNLTAYERMKASSTRPKEFVDDMIFDAATKNVAQAQININIQNSINLLNFGGIFNDIMASLKIALNGFEGQKKVIACVGQIVIILKNLTCPITIAAAITTIITLMEWKSDPDHQWIFTSLWTSCKELVSMGSEMVSTLSDIASDVYGFFQAGEKSFTDYAKDQLIQNTNVVKAVTSIGGLAVALIASFILGKIPGRGTFDELMNRVKNLPATVKSFSDITEFGSTLTKELLRMMRVYLFGCDEEEFDSLKTVTTWQNEVEEMLGTPSAIRMKADAAYQMRCQSLLARGLQIARDYDKIGMERNDLTGFRAYLQTAQELYRQSLLSGASQMKLRQEPIVVQLYGDSGTGKTTLLSFLTASIGKHLGYKTPEEISAQVYNRQIGMDYWDGYAGQAITLIDEFGALKDSLGMPNLSFLELIHMVTPAANPLHMASLHEKATTFFTSLVVFLTSNSYNHTINSLDHEEAVTRRLETRVFVKLRPEYCKERTLKQNSVSKTMDFDKVKADFGAFSTEPYLFDIIHPDNTKTDDKLLEYKDLTYDQLVAIIIDRLEKKKLKTINLTETIQAFLNAETIPIDVSTIAKCQVKTVDVEVDMEDYEEEAEEDETPFFGTPHECLVVEKTIADIKNITGTKDIGKLPQVQKLYKEFLKEPEAKSGYLGNMVTRLQGHIGGSNTVHIDSREYMINSVPGPDIAGKINIEAMRYDDAIDKLSTLYECDCFAVEDSKFGFNLALNVLMCKTIASKCNYGLNAFCLSMMVRVAKEDLENIHVCAETHASKRLLKLKAIRDKSGGILSEFHRYLKKKTNPVVRPIMFALKSVLKSMMMPLLITFFASLFCVLLDRVVCWILGKKASAKKKKKTSVSVAEGASYDANVQKTRKVAPAQEESNFYDNGTNLARKTDQVRAEVAKYAPVDPARKNATLAEAKYDDPTKVKKTQPVAERSIAPIEDTLIRQEADVIVADSQGCISQNAASLISKIMMRSQYQLEYLAGEKWCYAGVITFTHGTMAICNAHVADYVARYEFIRIRGEGCAGTQVFKVSDLQYAVADTNHPKYGQRDACLMLFPIQACQFPDIRGHFADSYSFARYSEIKNAALIGYLPSEDLAHRVQITGNVKATDRVQQVRVEGEETIKIVRDVFKYDLITFPGDCGSLLVSLSDSQTKRIVGIHCAGTSIPGETGIAAPISREFIDYLESALKPTQEQRISEPDIATANIKIARTEISETEYHEFSTATHKGSFHPIGELDHGTTSGSKSAIRESPIGNAITEYTTGPAKLGPFRVNGKVIDPKFNAIEKGNVVPTPMEPMLLTAIRLYKQRQNRRGGDEYRRVLTLAESIKGVENDPLIPPMNRKSSPGYPLQRTNPGAGKKFWLGEGEHYIVDHPQVVAEVAQMEEDCRNGIRPEIIFVDTLKDERRPLERVVAGKTRVFACGPLIGNILMRKYFAGYLAYKNKNKIYHRTCVGVNPYSREWDSLARHLLSKGNSFLAGDFGNYDATLGADVLFALCDEINDFYYRPDMSEDEEAQWQVDNKIRKVLFSCLAFAIHLDGRELVSWVQSQPSGCILTVNLNSELNSYYSIAAYLLMARKFAPELCSMQSYEEYVAEVNYGDDNVKSIHPTIRGWYNMTNLIEAYRTLGLTYTDEEKNENTTEFREITEISFLKRKFRFDNAQKRFRAPLALKVILEMAQWVKGAEDEQSLTADTLKTAVYELSQHDQETFDKYMPKFEKAALKLNVPVVFETYQFYQDLEAAKYCNTDLEYQG